MLESAASLMTKTLALAQNARMHADHSDCIFSLAWQPDGGKVCFCF